MELHVRAPLTACGMHDLIINSRFGSKLGILRHTHFDELSQASGGLITCFKPTLSRALDILSDSHTFIIT